MKWYLLLLLYFFMFSLLANAQFGVKGGVGLSYISSNNDLVTDKASRVDFQFVVLYKYNFPDDRFGVQGGGEVYSERGFIWPDGISDRRTARLSGVTLLGVLNMLEDRLTFHVGPQFCF